MSKKHQDLKSLRRLALDQGWRVVRTSRGEMWYPPQKDRPAVTVHLTPSDHRAHLNMIAQLRRSGLDV